MTFPDFITTLRQADEQATKGPWEVVSGLYLGEFPATGVKGSSLTCIGFETDNGAQKKADAHTIALLRNTLAQTIAIMEVARRALEEWKCPCCVNGKSLAYADGDRERWEKCNSCKGTGKHSTASRALAEMDALAAKTP